MDSQGLVFVVLGAGLLLIGVVLLAKPEWMQWVARQLNHVDPRALTESQAVRRMRFTAWGMVLLGATALVYTVVR